jgi:hypothetical protein
MSDLKRNLIWLTVPTVICSGRQPTITLNQSQKLIPEIFVIPDIFFLYTFDVSALKMTTYF